MKKYAYLIAHVLVPWIALIVLHQITHYGMVAKQNLYVEGLIILFKSWFIEGFIIGAVILIIYHTQTRIMKDFEYGDFLCAIILAVPPALSFFCRIYVIPNTAPLVVNSGLGDESGIILASALFFISIVRAVCHRARLIRFSGKEDQLLK